MHFRFFPHQQSWKRRPQPGSVQAPEVSLIVIWMAFPKVLHDPFLSSASSADMSTVSPAGLAYSDVTLHWWSQEDVFIFNK